MVLHNNKWDRKAKGRYLKKHGIQPQSEKNTLEQQDPVEEKKLEISEADIPENDLNDQIAESIELLPEFDDDFDELLKQHLKAQAEKSKATVIEAAANEVATKPEAKLQNSNKALFAKANAGVERSKLNEAIKSKIGRKVKDLQLNEEDLDIDEFMAQLDLSKSSKNYSVSGSRSQHLIPDLGKITAKRVNDTSLPNPVKDNSTANNSEVNTAVDEKSAVNEDDEQFLDSLL